MSDPELAAVLQQLADADAGKRQLAVMALEELADAASVDPLIAALRDPDATVRRLAVGVLEELGDPRAVEPLVSALEDASPAVRTAARTALRAPDAA